MTICTQFGLLVTCRASSWEVFSRTAVGDKWCFSCRKQLPHDWIVEGEGGITYYDPIGRFDCSRCHRDKTRFPAIS